MNGKVLVKNRGWIFLRGAIIGIAVTVIVMLLMSAVMLLFDVNEAFAVPFATVSLAVGSFAAAFYTARKVGNRGYLIGLLVGVVSFLAVMLLSLLVSKQSVGANTLFHLVIVLISSMLGGILGINLKGDKKYI